MCNARTYPKFVIPKNKSRLVKRGKEAGSHVHRFFPNVETLVRFRNLHVLLKQRYYTHNHISVDLGEKNVCL